MATMEKQLDTKIYRQVIGLQQFIVQKVQKFFRRASVVEDITNTDYAGEIENFGDTVNIIKEPTITVNDYARGQTVNTQTLADDQIQLTVDQGSYFAFKVDDIEERTITCKL
jgi:hypothetical protein